MKNPPTLQEMQESPVLSLGWEDPLEECVATHCSMLAEKIPDRGAWWATVCGVAKSDTAETAELEHQRLAEQGF